MLCTALILLILETQVTLSRPLESLGSLGESLGSLGDLLGGLGEPYGSLGDPLGSLTPW